MFENYMLAKIGEAHAFQFFKHAVLECHVVLASERPFVVDVRDVRQDFEAVAAFGSNRRIGAGRCY